MDRKSLVILDAGGGTAIQSPTGGRGKMKVGVEDTAGSLTIYEASDRPAMRVDRCSISTCSMKLFTCWRASTRSRWMSDCSRRRLELSSMSPEGRSTLSGTAATAMAAC
jgi:hypothetical protein